jgi:hypothetical protein
MPNIEWSAAWSAGVGIPKTMPHEVRARRPEFFEHRVGSLTGKRQSFVQEGGRWGGGVRETSNASYAPGGRQIWEALSARGKHNNRFTHAPPGVWPAGAGVMHPLRAGRERAVEAMAPPQVRREAPRRCKPYSLSNKWHRTPARWRAPASALWRPSAGPLSSNWIE